MYLETELPKIGLRPLEKRDLPDLVRHANNPQIAGNLRDRFPSPYMETDAIGYLDMQSNEGLPQNLAITKADKLIGIIGYIPQQDVYRLTAEFGYWVSEEYWGKGIATAAIKAFVPWLFANSDLIRLYANVFAFNPVSRRVLEKAGFFYEGHARDAVIKRGIIYDEYRYAILKATGHED